MFGKLHRPLEAVLAAWLFLCAGNAFGVITMEKIGNPLWEPTDVHLFAGKVGMNPTFNDYFPTMNSVLKTTHPNAPHAGPYNHEIADGMALAGYHDADTYTLSQFQLPNAVYMAYGIVPSSGAPTGRTRDFLSGPILPNASFPMSVKVFRAHQGTDYTDLDQWYDIPPWNVLPRADGYSHLVPGFYSGTRWLFVPPAPNPFGHFGWWEWRLQLREPNGAGWNVNARFTAVPEGNAIPEPGTLVLLLAGSLPALRLLRRR
jgi:hypothetical protein